MLYMNIILTVKDAANVAQIKELLTEQGRRSRAEPGCARFEVYHSKNDERKFILNEHWESQAALDEHRRAYAYTQIYQPKVLPLVDREPHPGDLLQ